MNLGEDPATALAAVASRQVDGLMNGEPILLEGVSPAAACRHPFRRYGDRTDGTRQDDGEALRRCAYPPGATQEHRFRAGLAGRLSRPGGQGGTSPCRPPSTRNTPLCRNGSRTWRVRRHCSRKPGIRMHRPDARCPLGAAVDRRSGAEPEGAVGRGGHSRRPERDAGADVSEGLVHDEFRTDELAAPAARLHGSQSRVPHRRPPGTRAGSRTPSSTKCSARPK